MDLKTKTVHVAASSPYDIFIGHGIIDSAGVISKNIIAPAKSVIVTDDTVASLYLDRVKSSLEAAGYAVSVFVFPHGEESKCADTYLRILSFLAKEGLDREGCLFALGGGVVGDICGFCAATYMRGIKYVQIPTTLLSAVDSSVGGKCAIDIPEGKNLVGAFYNPSAVICDPDTLNTLPEEYFSDGMAEVIKYAMIHDSSLFSLFEGGTAKKNICALIERCVSIKRDIVEDDERESGVRAILNFGHTPAHAIEAHSGFSVSHGRAVGIGMVMMTRISKKRGLCSSATEKLLIKALSDYKLDTECPYTAEELLPYIFSDKKRSGNGIKAILSLGRGRCRIERMSFDELSSELGGI